MPMPEDVPINQNLRLFGELLSCQGDYFLWSYDPDGNLLSSNCQNLYLDIVLKRSPGYAELLSHAANSNDPMVISGSLGLIWGAVPEFGEDGLHRIHILGPVFTQLPSHEEIDRHLHGSLAVRKWAPKLIRRLQSLPVIPFTNFCQRILMLTYCVRGEHLAISDLVFFSADGRGGGKNAEESADMPDRRKVYQAETMLLDIVRRGDLSYREHLTEIASVYRGDQRVAKLPIQHARLSQVIIVALLTRAAMEGGVSPEIIYPLQDSTLRRIDRAESAPEITEIGLSLIDELVLLVRQSQEKSGFSRPIQLCCSYIDAHLEDDLSISLLAGQAGYTNYYLSRKFRAETGMGVQAYILARRIERAKSMLLFSDLPLPEIAERLQFGSRNSFSDAFRKATGQSPAKWREENRIV